MSSCECLFGMDALQFARAGASVVGVDFSPLAIDAARDLAVRAGLADRARFVCGDVTEAPALLGGERFDVAYVSLGSLCWLPSIDAWAEAVAGVLDSLGTLYLFDVHPLARCLDDDGERVARGYFEEPDAQRDDFGYTYTDGERLAHTTTYEWGHGLAQLLWALSDRGLALRRFEEHDWTVFRPVPVARGVLAAPLDDPCRTPARAAVDDRRGRRHVVAEAPLHAPTNHGSARSGG